MKSILFITLSILSILSISGQVKKVNTVPVPFGDTIGVHYDKNAQTNIFVFSLNLLDNDTDKEGDKIKVTSFTIGSTVYKPGAVCNYKELAWITVRANGYMSIVVFPGWNSNIAFSYVVNDSYHTTGRRAYILVHPN